MTRPGLSVLAPPAVGSIPNGITSLDDLRAELADVRVRLERLERQRPPPSGLSRADVALLTRLLPVVVGIFGSSPFTSRDLVEHVAVRLVLEQRNAIQIGRLLRRATGQPIAGLVVERAAGIAINVRLWRVLGCGQGSGSPGLNPAPRVHEVL